VYIVRTDSQRENLVLTTMAYNKGTDVLIFWKELRRLADLTKRSAVSLFVQSWHETAGFTSALWKNKKNPAGIKTKDGKNYQTYPNGVDSARAQFVHMSAYLEPSLHKALTNYKYLDERYDLALKATESHAVFTTFHELAGWWAEDPQYGEKIDRVYNDLFN